MAKYRDDDILLKTNQRLIFGDNQEGSVKYDGQNIIANLSIIAPDDNPSNNIIVTRQTAKAALKAGASGTSGTSGSSGLNRSSGTSGSSGSSGSSGNVGNSGTSGSSGSSGSVPPGFGWDSTSLVLAGYVQLNINDTTAGISFFPSRDNDNYSITATMYNPDDSKTYLWSFFNKSKNGFKVKFDRPIESDNVVFECMVKDYDIQPGPYPTPEVCVPETRNTLTEVAATLTSSFIYDLISFGGSLYGAAGNVLQRWNPLLKPPAWEIAAPSIGAGMRGFAEYGGELFAACINEDLIKFDGVSSLVLVASGGGSEDSYGGIVIHNNPTPMLFMTFGTDLWRWNGSSLTKVANAPFPGMRCFDLISYGGQLYMTPWFTGTPSGYLYRWNGLSWVIVHDNQYYDENGVLLGAFSKPTYFLELNGRFYCCNDGGGVFSTDGTKWIYEGNIPNQNFTQAAAIQNESIYVVSDYTSRLGRWNRLCGPEDLTPGSGNVKRSIAVHNGELYCGTQNGKLERFD
jgi:hypothetical protein